MEELPGKLSDLIDVVYAGAASYAVLRISCRKCGFVIHDYEASGDPDPETLSQGLVNHFNTHGIEVRFNMCDDPGCQHMN